MPFPWQPGMRLTDGRMNEHLPVTRTKSATEARTSTTVTADSELSLTLGPGTWDVHIWLAFAGTATADSGIVGRWGLSSGLSLSGFRMVQGPAAGSSGATSINMRSSVNSAGTSIEYGAGSGFGAIESGRSSSSRPRGPSPTSGEGRGGRERPGRCRLVHARPPHRLTPAHSTPPRTTRPGASSRLEDRMAWYPRAKKYELQPESDAQPAIRPTQFIVHSIIAPWTAKRTYEYWRDSTNLESHFGLGYEGDLGQFIGTETRADANAGGEPAGRRYGCGER